MLALLMQESLEESSALDSCAVTRMRGRTASPGARRQDCGQAQVLPLGHTYTRIVCVGVAAGPRAWCSVTCVCLCSALGTSPQAMCTGLLLEAALYLAAWLAQALLSGCVF